MTESRPATKEEHLNWAKDVCAATLDELHRKVFKPEMILSLLARDPEDPDKYILLTKEESIHDLIEFLTAAAALQTGDDAGSGNRSAAG